MLVMTPKETRRACTNTCGRATRVAKVLRKLFNRFRKPTLRELCRQKYGDEFAKMYDTLNQGEPIGGFAETMAFIEMIRRVETTRCNS